MTPQPRSGKPESGGGQKNIGFDFSGSGSRIAEVKRNVLKLAGPHRIEASDLSEGIHFPDHKAALPVTCTISHATGDHHFARFKAIRDRIASMPAGSVHEKETLNS
ncbi:hypothetical protein [Paenibacillus jiagnxiensis]|uniref:hypothetical protein n=1 Tax=Paenibacillus jiagnxiensis TaxID=3228926 RepID=UPI0038D49AF5